MNTVERVKQICKERGIAISKLERECGFANAYIMNLRAGKMPADRLQKIADYLNVSTKYLLSGETDTEYYSQEAKEIAQEIHDDPELKALFSVSRKASAEQLRVAKAVLEALLANESEE